MKRYLYAFFGSIILLIGCQDKASQKNLLPQNQIYEFFEVTEKPSIRFKGQPVYPEFARKKGIEGKVVVKVVIDFNGDVQEAVIWKSVPELDEAALEAAKQCKFKPAKRKGKFVKVRMNVPFEFKLN